MLTYKYIHFESFLQVDGLIHANLFVQAHSEIVLILLAKCDLYQNEDTVRSLVSVEEDFQEECTST